MHAKYDRPTEMYDIALKSVLWSYFYFIFFFFFIADKSIQIGKFINQSERDLFNGEYIFKSNNNNKKQDIVHILFVLTLLIYIVHVLVHYSKSLSVIVEDYPDFFNIIMYNKENVHT